MSEADVLALAKQATIIYKAEEEVLFDQGADTHAFFYVVKEGAIHLLRFEGENSLLVDTCDEGDVLGLRPLLADQQYGLQAVTIEPSLIYGIDLEQFRPLLAKYAEVSFYLAKTFAKGLHQNYEDSYRNVHFFHQDGTGQNDLLETQQLQPHRAPVVCNKRQTIQEAAKEMQAQRVSSIVVVNDQRHPIGILTDKDLRNRVVTGSFPIDTSVEKIMSNPVLTVKAGLSLAEIQMAMIKHKLHHLVQTEDGTPDTPITGVITEHDLLVLQANNPAALVRRIKHSNNREDLKEVRLVAEQLLQKYITQDVNIDFIASIINEVNDALLIKIIQLKQADLQNEALEVPSGSFCWLNLGSGGRQEQLLRTDQDNALVYSTPDPKTAESTKAYYLELARRVTADLNYCGFEYCPAEMMASNPKWCLSLKAWKTKFGAWMKEPGSKEILMSSIFFDFRPVAGDFSLSQDLKAFILAHVDNRTPFLNFLAKDAIQNPPPLSFFRNFVVEKGGDHVDSFDIKARAMMPLTDAARVLSLSTGQMDQSNTIARFEALHELEPQNAALYQQAADAYRILMQYRARFGLLHHSSGRYLDPKALSKMERLELRNSFQPIRELQTLLSTRFNLAFFI
ncbi:MAG: DUF294 nucleotidyltransferase-like domain-containing protein [Saprospiraceae bacterium]